MLRIGSKSPSAGICSVEPAFAECSTDVIGCPAPAAGPVDGHKWDRSRRTLPDEASRYAGSLHLSHVKHRVHHEAVILAARYPFRELHPSCG